MRMALVKRSAFVALSLLFVSSVAVAQEAGASNKVGFPPDGKGLAHPRATGWVYRNCSYVTTALTSTGFIVKVTNTDNSWVSAASKGPTPTVAQLALLRACRETGASWGYYISGNYWTTLVSY